VQLLPLVGQRSQVEQAIVRSEDFSVQLTEFQGKHESLKGRLKQLEQTIGTHGSQILKLLENGVEKWPEVQNDIAMLKSDKVSFVRDIACCKKEVAELRETSTRTWREIAGLHQDNAQFSAISRGRGPGQTGGYGSAYMQQSVSNPNPNSVRPDSKESSRSREYKKQSTGSRFNASDSTFDEGASSAQNSTFETPPHHRGSNAGKRAGTLG